MKSTIAALVLIVGCCCGVASRSSADDPARQEKAATGFRVVGYLPDYRVAAFDPNTAKHLTDLIYFAVEPSAAGDAGVDRIKPETLRLLKRIKADQHIRIHLCLGGWNRSKGFPKLAASREARENLILQLTKFCSRNGFDGVDLDWEHPTSASELRDHGRLVSEMKQAFSPLKLRLTAASAGWQEISPEAIEALDAVHLMAYDAAGRHSTFEFAEADLDRTAKRKIPLNKLILGVPFYGRSVTNADMAVSYSDIVKKRHPKPDVNEADGVYFNGQSMIEKKTKLALERRLAGIMIWELGQDTSGEDALLPIIGKTVKENGSK